MIKSEDVLRLRARLLHFLRAKFGPSFGELEDSAQHAFVMLFRERDKVQPDNDGLYRFLHVVARNHALDRLRTARKHDAGAVRAARAIAHRRPAAFTPYFDETEAVRTFFCELNELDRLILWSHVVDGRSISAVAAELNLTWYEVAQTVERLLCNLRGKLEPRAAASTHAGNADRGECYG